MSLNKEYSNKSLDNSFWREIGVSIDRISEYSHTEMLPKVKALLQIKSKKELRELTTLYDLELKEDKTDMINLLLTLEENNRREILILNDFQNRRKQSINKYYKIHFSKSDIHYTSSSLTQLKHLLTSSHLTMVELFTLYSWGIKGSGDLYTFEKGITKQHLNKIPTEYSKTIINTLYKGSGNKNEYRVFSYFETESSVLVTLYKKINDAPRADFDKAVRNKEVVPLMFEVNIKEKLIEIKSPTQTDKQNLLKYFKENYVNCSPSPIKLDVFEEYDKSEVISSFLKRTPNALKKVEDFIVNKIVFRESPIKNSPRVTLELENEEIWPSVTHAHINNCVNIESLKDIESMTVKTEGVTRKVRSIMLDNGNIVFTLDDSRLSENTKRKIFDKFKNSFGIPINQEIANSKFKAGEADKIDYFLSQSKPQTIIDSSKDTYDSLVKDKILYTISHHYFFCKECNFEQKIKEKEDVPTECPECGCNEIKRKNITEQKYNSSTIKSFTKKTLSKFDDFELAKSNSNIVFDDEKLEFIKLKNKDTDEIIQVLIIDQVLSQKMLRRMKTMMTSTIIIFIGQSEKNIQSYSSDCIHAITFGSIYVQEEHMFGSFYSEIYNKLKIRQKSIVGNAATLAEEALKSLETFPSEIDAKYTDKKFEDDVYAILKDIFPNSEKWGKEASGKAVPEGIFAVSFNEKGRIKNEKKSVYSYDCKFTRQDSGYELNRGEKRKAVEYVETLNGNDIIQSFSNSQELTGHIFISNKFKESQISTVKDYFYEKLSDSSNAMPIFLSLEVLLFLYRSYREEYEQVNNMRDLFNKELVKLLSKDSKDSKTSIEIDDVKKLIKKVQNENLREHAVLDTKSVSEYIED